jgi:hypothetical protein
MLFNAVLSQACSIEQVQPPPRLMNGKWHDQSTELQAAQQSVDTSQLERYDFIFTAQYLQETNNPELHSAYLETESVWQGHVPNHIKLNEFNLQPTDNCSGSPLSYDQRYVFFATFGNRNNPILIKNYLPDSEALKNTLSKPVKRWVRGRLITLKN